MAKKIVGALVTVVFCAAIYWLAWPANLGGQMSYVLVSGSSMEPTMHTGDLAVMREQASYAPGDIVAFRVPKGDVGEGSVVIHRILSTEDGRYVMRGDNRDVNDPWLPANGDVVGKRVLLVPRFGEALGLLAHPVGLGTLAGVLAAIVVLTGGNRNETPVEPLSQHADPSRPRGRRRTHLRRPPRARRRPSQPLGASGTGVVDLVVNIGGRPVVPGDLQPSGARARFAGPRDGSDTGGELGVGVRAGSDGGGLRRVHGPVAGAGTGRHPAVD